MPLLKGTVQNIEKWEALNPLQTHFKGRHQCNKGAYDALNDRCGEWKESFIIF
jgi:hypothetical protein